MTARQTDTSIKLFVLFPLRQEQNICSHCDVYQYKKKWRRSRNQSYWACCANGKMSVDMITSKNDFENVAAMSDDTKIERDEKLRVRTREREMKTKLQNRMYEVEEMKRRSDEDSKSSVQYRLIKACRDFQECIVSYNNVLSFASEAAKVDQKYSDWTTFRAMRGCLRLSGSRYSCWYSCSSNSSSSASISPFAFPYLNLERSVAFFTHELSVYHFFVSQPWGIAKSSFKFLRLASLHHGLFRINKRCCWHELRLLYNCIWWWHDHEIE